MSISNTLYDPELSDDLTWRIDTDRADGGIIANGVEEDMPEYQRGGDLTLTFLFWDDAGMTGQAGLLFGDPDHGGTFGGDHGGTFGVDDDQGTHMDRYREARQFLDYAGSATVKQAMNGKPHYVERLPADAPVDSLVVAVEPGPGLEATNGFWGVVMGGDDSTRFVRDMAALQIDFKVLAERDDYLTRSDIEADLGSGII